MSSATDIIEQYPQPADVVYLDTPSFGLTSTKGVELARDFLQQQQKLGSKFVDRFRGEQLPSIRKTVGKFLDAKKSEFAFIPNFSFGMSAILGSLQGLQRVLLYKNDYPSLVQPFLINDYKVFWMDEDNKMLFDVEAIKQSIIQHNIEIVAVSQVQYLTGVAADIEALGRICRENGAILIVDGTQSLGATPFSFNESSCHMYIASNYKWMNAGHGTGILCIKEEILTKFTPKIGGFNSYLLIDNSWQYIPSIHSYEPGHLNFLGLLLLQSAIEYKMQIGMEQIQQHNQQLVGNLLSRLKDTQYKVIAAEKEGPESNIVCFKGDENLLAFLTKRGFALRMRDHIMRIGIHFYNSQEDIDRFVDALLQYRKH